MQVIRLGISIFLRDFNYRYRQAYFGYFWAILRPLSLGAGVMLFSSAQSGEAAPSPISMLAGILLLQSFWDSVILPQWVTRRVRRFVKRVPFNHGAIVVASACYTLFNTAMSVLVMVVALIFLDSQATTWGILTLLCLPGILLTGHAVGLFFAPMSMVYLDIRYGLPMLFPAIMFTVPILYAFPSREAGLLYYVNTYNPLTYLLMIPRDYLFGTLDQGSFYFLGCVAASGVLFLIGMKFFKRAMLIAVDQI